MASGGFKSNNLVEYKSSDEPEEYSVQNFENNKRNISDNIEAQNVVDTEKTKGLVRLKKKNGWKTSPSASIGGLRQCIAGCEGFQILHKVPTKIEEANLWFNLLGRPDLINAPNTNSCRVCNLHFSEKMRGSSGKRLHIWSLPDMNLPKNSIPPRVPKPYVQPNFQREFIQQTQLYRTPLQQSSQVVTTPIQQLSQVASAPVQQSHQVVRTPIQQSSQVVKTSIQQSPQVVTTSIQQFSQVARAPIQHSSQVIRLPMQMPQILNTQLYNVGGSPATSPIFLPNMVQSNIENAPILRLSNTKQPGIQYSVVKPLVMQPTIRYTPQVNLSAAHFNNLSCFEEKDLSSTSISINQFSLDNPLSTENVLESFHQELAKEFFKQELLNSKPNIENIIEVPQHLVVKLVLTKRGDQLPEEHKGKLQNNSNVENNNARKCYCKVAPKDADSILKHILKEPVKQKVKVGHKSIQCRLAREHKVKNEVKEEKKENSEPVQQKVDKCTSTEDVEEDFDMFMQLLVPEIKNFRYIEDGKCECLICGKKFESSAYARIHLQIHQEKSRLCSKCGKLFKKNPNFAAHERTCLHESENTDKDCSVDNKSTIAGPSPYSTTAIDRICKFCGKYSNCLVKHLDHLNSHTGERPHKCSCGSQFRNLPNFYTHRKKFGCKNAPAEIPYGIRMRKRKTGGTDSKLKNNEHNRSGKSNGLRRNWNNPDRYVCKVCGIRCHDYSSFRSHKKKHITERKYVCPVCNNSYKEVHSLRSHVKNSHLHRSECRYCGRRCSPHHMPIHVRQHTGERPYACVLCDQKFISKVILKSHKRNEHNIGAPLYSNKSLLKCCMCNHVFSSKKTLENHLAKPIHLEKEEMWKEVAGVTKFTCMFCNSDYEHFGQYAGHLGSAHNSHIFRKMEEILDEFEHGISAEPLPCNTDPENEPEMIEEYIEEIDLEVDNQIDQVNTIMSDIKHDVIEIELGNEEFNEIQDVCGIKSEDDDEIVESESIGEHMIEFLNFHEVKDLQIEFIDQHGNNVCDLPEL